MPEAHDIETVLRRADRRLDDRPWGYLPPRMRVLFITGRQRTGGWLAEAFASDSASDVLLAEAHMLSDGLGRLRDELFDAVLVSHETGGCDAMEAVDAIRAATSDEQPIIILGDQSEQQMASLGFESGADAYVCVNTTTTRTLIWQVARAVERHALIAENRRLQQSHRQRLRLEHDEAQRLLQQQRAMINNLSVLHAADWPDEAVTAALETDDTRYLPDRLTGHYRELLRAYVIMGSGNLGDEMERLAGLFAAATVTPQQVMRLHLLVLEEMIGGLGSRSARHVMNRADMLILEVMMHLAEQYRRCYYQRVHPPRQMNLPGFEVA